MPLRPYSRGLSSFRREPVRGAAAKMGLPWDAYYVLTKAEARLTNSKLHPNTGSPDYNITHLHTGLEDTNWATEPSHDPRYFTHAEVLDLIEGAAFSFHPSDTADGVIAGYNTMFDADTDEAESTIAVEITADDTLIKAFITETGQPAFSVMSAGVYAGQLHLSATTAGKKDTKIYWTLSKRAAGGAETLLITSEESAVLTNVDTHYEIHGVLSTDQTLLSDDRLVFKVYGNQDTGAGGDATATLAMEGTTATRVDVLTHFLAFDDRYVQVAGDTMTGSLTVEGTGTFDGLTVTAGNDLRLDNNLTDGTNSLTVANAKTAYDHSQDNTQAHTDYMLNTGDTTTGDYNFTAGNLITTGTLGTGAPTFDLTSGETALFNLQNSATFGITSFAGGFCRWQATTGLAFESDAGVFRFTGAGTQLLGMTLTTTQTQIWTQQAGDHLILGTEQIQAIKIDGANQDVDVLQNFTAGTIQADDGFTGDWTNVEGRLVEVVGGIIVSVA
ncbi:hypothetical protein LCGC14_1609360 [marine sediment metagenome]|uniref:Uncharacterized protein n=1 Tax=marine sediment metagenome TaxID=412755 RepID=A0A0F9I964_9ZZZZ